MKQFAVIGLGAFGLSVVEEMLELGAEIIVIDRKSEAIDVVKDRVHAAYIVDVVSEEAINKLIPKNIDSVVLDLGDNLEAKILVTNYLKKMGIENIVVKEEEKSHGEVLYLIGAKHIIYPDFEAAKRVTPLLVSDTLFNFMPISSGLVMAEIFVPKKYIGKSLIEANLRQNEGVNIVAIKKAQNEEYAFFTPAYVLAEKDVLLAVGSEENILKFTAIQGIGKEKSLASILKKLLRK